jgi:predicted nucleotidyltransferase
MSLALDSTAGLPADVERALSEIVATAQAVLGPDLRSIVLYGSGAEGRLRPTSDVNAIVVLAAFDPAKVDRLREPLRTAYAAIRLTVTFLLEHEVAPAVEAFAVKFADIRRRRRVLLGADPFTNLAPSRNAEMARLRQVLLNLTLRLRQSYVLRSLREEQAVLVIAEATGPLRACAAALLELGGMKVASPREALEQVVTTLSGKAWKEVLARLTDARAHRVLPPGVAGETLLRLIDLATMPVG